MKDKIYIERIIKYITKINSYMKTVQSYEEFAVNSEKIDGKPNWITQYHFT